MAPFFRRLRGDGPFDALRTLTLYNVAEWAVRRKKGTVLFLRHPHAA